MSLNFKYNKTALQELNKGLKIRQVALPTLKAKEGALRAEVLKAKRKARDINAKFEEKMRQIGEIAGLWNEYREELLQIGQVDYYQKKIAGVRIPILKEVHFETRDYALYQAPSWFPDGMEILKELIRIRLERDAYTRSMAILEEARKKTTQKVNLYEKVQIPAYEDAIKKIKRFLEDEENLSKSAQKILKKRKATL